MLVKCSECGMHTCTCERCEKSWRTVRPPANCAKCNSPYWNTPRTPAGIARRKKAVETILRKNK